MGFKIDKVLIEKFFTNIEEALRVITANKVRTLLTALGIIFGVAAVITMLAIGKGAEKEILDQLKLVGVNNIVITPINDELKDGEENEQEGPSNENKSFSKGLDLLDSESILKYIPSVKAISPEVLLETYTILKGRQNPVKLIGVATSFFETANIKIETGKNFSDKQLTNALPVCIIGKKVAQKLFTGEEPLGKQIKVKDVWLQVVGVIEEKIISEKAQENLAIRDLNRDIYIPIKTFLVRFKDRKIMSLNKAGGGGGGFYIVQGGGNSGPKNRIPRGNYHQIDKLTVQVNDSEELKATADIISRMLKRKHNNQLDFEIKIPVNELKQQQRTKQVFNIVLSLIAAISLLIGGIGIMNIMLASVLERTKEIGIMRAIGATKQDIILQFLAESVLISLGGGIIGVLLGISAAIFLEKTTDIQTILSIDSILLSFIVSTLIGLIFGITPAKAAANKNPIEAMRHE